MRVRVIGDRLVTELFALAGIRGEAVQTAEEVGAAIDRCIGDSGVGVILVTSSMANKLGDRFKKYLQRRKLPLVLRIPDRENREGSAGEIREYLQKTLGIRL